MQVDLSKLSAKELFELAKQKEQEEKEASVRQAIAARVDELTAKRGELVAGHEKELAGVDNKIVELTEQRAQLIASHDEALSEIDSEIESYTRKLAQKSDEEAPKEAAASTKKSEPATEAESGGVVDQPVDASERIIEMLKVRSYVSHGMLEETLRSEGIDVSNLAKQIDQLVRGKIIIRRSGGNYALNK
jgi:chromosome segregation ATPase